MLPTASDIEAESRSKSATTEEEEEWDRDLAADRASREALKLRFLDPGPYTRRP